MAGIAIPDNLRPTLTAIAKYHFWILAALVPLLLVPLLFIGAGSLKQRIATQQRQIESKLGQARAVTAVQPHPNEGWRTTIDADTDAAARETLDEWRRFWHSQRSLRVWPAELGEPFLADVAKLKPGGKLERPSLVRYQNMAPRLVRALPARMGVEDMMVEKPADGGPANPALAPKLSWNDVSQRRLHDSFVWPRVPNTTQVLLAQEELWVYGLFCDLIAGFIKAQGATGAHDSPLTRVEGIDVGFPAGTRAAVTGQEIRILMPQLDAAAMEGLRAMGAPPPGDTGSSQPPWHPRFPGSGQVAGPRPGVGGEQLTGPSEDDYRGWVYVDFSGRPLSAAELAAAPALRMVHLMPFVLMAVVDQRKLDAFLAALAAAPVPIDVREIRVNPGFLNAAGTPGGVAIAGRRPNDVLVELRGTVALATPPQAAPATPEVAP